jgi:hypothetical protein
MRPCIALQALLRHHTKQRKLLPGYMFRECLGEVLRRSRSLRQISRGFAVDEGKAEGNYTNVLELLARLRIHLDFIFTYPS